MREIPVRPLAASRLAREALAANPRPRVAGIFRRGLALDAGGPDGLVFCGTREAGLLPSQLVLREADVERWLAACAPGDAVAVAATDDGVACVLLDRARAYDVPAIRTSTAARLREGARALDRWLRPCTATGGLGERVGALLDPGHGLADAFRAAVAGGERTALRRWIGRGGGSTPAGDDMLLGALAWQRAVGARHAPLVTALRGLAPELAALTTRTSACYLRWALQGRFAGDLVALVAAIARGSREAVARRASRVAAHGATSGHDTLAGLVLASRLDAEVPAPAPVR